MVLTLGCLQCYHERKATLNLQETLYLPAFLLTYPVSYLLHLKPIQQ